MATIPHALATAFKYQQAGQLRGAEQICRQILAADPGHVEALHLLGTIASRLGNHAEAVECMQRAIELKPHEPIFYSNLALIYRAQGKFDDAVAACHRALELNPGHVKAYNHLGVVLHEQGRLDEAESHYRRAIECDPNDAQAYSNLGTLYKDLGRLGEAVAACRQSLAIKPNYYAANRNLLFKLWFCPGYDSAAICEEHQRWNQRFAAPLASHIEPHTNDANPNRRLRIGYVSPDFRTHCQALFTVPLLSAHDHDRFEIVCYADVAQPDHLTERLQSYADRWTSIVGLSDQDIARMVRQDQIDILVDLTMHMHGGHLLTFARKPAPVQVCWLAYPGTTGLETMDYRLTDPYLDPPGENDGYYAERSVRLPDCFWCYDPLAEEPAVNQLPALNNGYITFGCLNNFCKVNESVLKLWAGVLQAVERSKLVLLAPEGSARQRIVEFFKGQRVSSDRIVFVHRQPRSKYLQVYHEIDVGLDTFPYNGHTTSLDSYWMGVPVITLVGKTVVGRAGLCQLRNLNLPEFIAETDDQFIETAVRITSNLPQLSRLRLDLRARMQQSPLMDASRFARNIESAYRTMWHKWCQSRTG